MLAPQSAHRFAAVAKCPDEDGHLVVYARVGEDAPRDGGGGIRQDEDLTDALGGLV